MTAVAGRATAAMRAWPRAVWAVLAVGFGGWIFRLWLVLGYRPTCTDGSPDCYTLAGDALYHHVQANLIADGEWFKNGAEYFLTGQLVDSAGDPPLYALYLAGFSTVGLDSVTAHRIGSTLAGFALVVLVGLFARRLATDVLGPRAGDRAGVIAALIAAVHPLMWINDIMLLSEGLYQPLVVLTVWSAYAWTKDPSRRRMLIMGAMIGVAALGRAEAVALLGFLIVPLLIWQNPLDWNERFRQAAIGIGIGIAVLAPWVIYNNLRFDEPVTLTSASGTVMLAGNCDVAWSGESMGIWARCFEARELEASYEEEFPNSWLPFNDPNRVIYDESSRDAFMTEAAFDYLIDNIDRYPQVALARMGRSLELFRVKHTLRVNYLIEGRWRTPSIIGLLGYYALIPFTALGLWVMRRNGERLVVPLSMWTMVLFASATTFGLTRYRVPIDVVMIVLAGLALAWLWARFDERKVEVSADDPILESS